MILYHYCTNQTCISILKGKTIRLSDVQKSNDSKELTLIFPGIYRQMLAEYTKQPFPLRYGGRRGKSAFMSLIRKSEYYIHSRMRSGDFSAFVICFSEARDKLSQWRGYADNGKGCCIGFSEEILSNYCLLSNGAIRFEKVEYLNSNEIDAAEKDYAKQILHSLKELPQWLEKHAEDHSQNNMSALMEYNLNTMVESVMVDSLKIKSNAFEEEQEWRLFLSDIPYKDPTLVYHDIPTDFGGPESRRNLMRFVNGRMDLRATEDDLIPFCEIRFDEFSESPVKEIWLGPKNKTRNQDFGLFLGRYSYPVNDNDKLQIHRSNISYR